MHNITVVSLRGKGAKTDVFQTCSLVLNLFVDEERTYDARVVSNSTQNHKCSETFTKLINLSLAPK